VANRRKDGTEDGSEGYYSPLVFFDLSSKQDPNSIPWKTWRITCCNVIAKAIELGVEILLRVPNLSFVLQGEDTTNFKVNTTTIATSVAGAVAILVVDVIVDVVDVVVSAATVAVAIDIAIEATVAMECFDADIVAVVVGAGVIGVAAYDVVVVVGGGGVFLVAYGGGIASTNDHDACDA